MIFYDFDSESGNFPLYLKGTLKIKIMDTIKKHFKFDDIDNNIKMDDSLVFNTKSKENELNKNLRLSKKISIKNPESFDILNKTIIKEINKISIKKNVIMQLIEDEIDIIKYEKGGFFKNIETLLILYPIK